MNSLPEAFLDRLKKILPSQALESSLAQFQQSPSKAFRINTLKSSREDVLKNLNGDYDPVSWYQDAFVLSGEKPDLAEKGLIYQQSLSSMLVPLVLDPKPGERILDMCAAPGSKTTQIAAMMNNKGSIVCVEAIKNRYYRLKSVLELMGVTIATVKLMDGRRFRSPENLFDRVLVDAPCSSEGRFRADNKKSYAYWSLRKIKEMVKKQRGLLLNASRWLKPGGILVYSTCTFAPEENEGVIDWFLRKTDNEFEVINEPFDGIETYPAVLQWGKKEYSQQLSHALRVFPNDRMEGFFIVKLRKIG